MLRFLSVKQPLFKIFNLLLRQPAITISHNHCYDYGILILFTKVIYLLLPLSRLKK